jgi:3-methyladenine DNA glycosylase AlkD
MGKQKKLGNSQFKEIISRLRSIRDDDAVKGMARFGIISPKVFGISMPVLRSMGREIGKNHWLAQQLWNEGWLETRILASLVDDPAEVTRRQMERWVREFDNWAVCDGCCSNLFDKSSFAWENAMKWTSRPEEFVKRAGFVLMAVLAVHDKQAADASFRAFLPIIVQGSSDERNFVKKAVNWALRQIGKRNRALNREAIRTAEKIGCSPAPSARWIAADALRELKGKAVQNKLKVQSEK